MLTKFKFNINRMDYFQRNVNYKIDFKIDLKKSNRNHCLHVGRVKDISRKIKRKATLDRTIVEESLSKMTIVNHLKEVRK